MNIISATALAAAEARRRRLPVLRVMLLAAALLVVIQAGIGMVVNLYVVVPPRHPGARPANYLAGSLHSVAWAISHGTAALAVHAILGLALAVFAVGACAYAVRTAPKAVTAWSVAGALLVIGAGFNGASFLDFGHDLSSLIMALLALGAIACFAVALFLLGSSPRDLPAALPRRGPA